MSHFYGRIAGNRGEATRMGTQGSGFNAWAQTHDGRVTVDFNHVGAVGFHERDEVAIRIGQSAGFGAVMSLNISDLANFVKVIEDPSNEKARDLRTKIEDLFADLNEAVEVAAFGDAITKGDA